MWTLAVLLLTAGATQLSPQQTAADRKLLEEERAMAKKGDATAQFNLGVRYAKGVGVLEDQTEAVKWYRKAAEQNYAEAQHKLGVRYATGMGVAKDEVEAVRCIAKPLNKISPTPNPTWVSAT